MWLLEENGYKKILPGLHEKEGIFYVCRQQIGGFITSDTIHMDASLGGIMVIFEIHKRYPEGLSKRRATIRARRIQEREILG